jgi:hypothetical protein
MESEGSDGPFPESDAVPDTFTLSINLSLSFLQDFGRVFV